MGQTEAKLTTGNLDVLVSSGTIQLDKRHNVFQKKPNPYVKLKVESRYKYSSTPAPGPFDSKTYEKTQNGPRQRGGYRGRGIWFYDFRKKTGAGPPNYVLGLEKSDSS